MYQLFPSTKIWSSLPPMAQWKNLEFIAKSGAGGAPCIVSLKSGTSRSVWSTGRFPEHEWPGVRGRHHFWGRTQRGSGSRRCGCWSRGGQFGKRRHPWLRTNHHVAAVKINFCYWSNMQLLPCDKGLVNFKAFKYCPPCKQFSVNYHS